MRSLLVVLLLAVAAKAADPPACKWSWKWKTLGCAPKDACRLKPSFKSFCVAKNAAATSEEPACDAPSAKDTTPAQAESAAEAADPAAAVPPSAEPSAEEEVADDEDEVA